MKLVEILARELKEWPEGVKSIWQDYDRELRFRGPIISRTYIRTKHLCTDGCLRNIHEDSPVKQVTRAEWQAAKDKLEGKTVKKPNANKDGWVRHRGGKCPVEAGVRVDYRMRDGYISTSLKGGESLRWNHDGTFGDIMAYRIHTPSEQPATAEESAPVEPVAPISGPLQWRDRITEIDAESKAENERHKAAMAALNSERAELVQKLASEGLAMIERKAEPVEDMSDPAKWREGDIVKCVGPTKHCTKGKEYSLRKRCIDHKAFVVDDDGDPGCPPASSFEFVRRPTN